MKAAQVLSCPACLSGLTISCDHLQGRTLPSLLSAPWTCTQGAFRTSGDSPHPHYSQNPPQALKQLWSHFGPSPTYGSLEPTTASTAWLIRPFTHRFLPVRSELWIHGQLCPSVAARWVTMQTKELRSWVSKEALKGQWWMQSVANWRRVPACLRNGLWCAGVEKGPHSAKERGVLGSKGSWPLR